ncbi:MAG: integrase arm-type DNA-binding domain-containing protein [Alphaproteobacteria bacterium]|jgi:integrase|nr:integrase arm-type DNA-binding domain-containing protein [Alphaproteobacteria bacterium]
MARLSNKLDAAKLRVLIEPGRYSDGNNLWLQVDKGGARSWLFRYTLNGKARQMGLGPLHTVSLGQARQKAREHRQQLLDGIDPLAARQEARRAALLQAAAAVTFRDAADRYMKAHEAGWRNAKHRQQWKSTLETYAHPVMGDLSVAAIDTGIVLKAVEPLWPEKPETASRLRGRIESVLDWATARGYRAGENPARWRGHLENLLPKRSKVRTVEHHAALPHADLPDFMTALALQQGIAARALEFTILTAARTGEVIGAQWSEFDLAAGLWTVPSDRMKAGKPHRVALSDRAIAILEEMVAQWGRDGFIFPGAKPGKGLSNMSMTAVLRRMKRGDLTVHGFRSTFRDWCAERTNYPNEMAEMALAHTVSNKVEAAYRRGDMFERRRRMMQDWAVYAYSSQEPAGDVVLLRREA